MSVKDAAEQLEDALKTVSDLRVYRDLGANVDPPAAVVGPPEIRWEAFDFEPTSARFLLYVLERFDERALERMWELVPKVARAIERSVSDAVVTPSAQPGSFNANGSDLPSYELSVEVAL